MLLLIFFFSSFGAHLDLLSFPTRRSSVLLFSAIDWLIDCLFDCLIGWLIFRLIDCLIDWLFDCLFVWLFDCLIVCLFDWLFDCWSEEHTSELQSRLHLVCRLLLEAKDWTPVTATYRMPSSAWNKKLNSSHGYKSYSVFCLQKKNKPKKTIQIILSTVNITTIT